MYLIRYMYYKSSLLQAVVPFGQTIPRHKSDAVATKPNEMTALYAGGKGGRASGRGRGCFTGLAQTPALCSVCGSAKLSRVGWRDLSTALRQATAGFAPNGRGTISK